MANCPKCNQEWLWSELDETYRTPDGELCPDTEITPDHPNEGLACTCGLVLAFYKESNNMFCNSVYEWLDVDWSLPENSWKEEQDG